MKNVEIDLYLTEQQAKTLKIIVHRIGGSPVNSLRKYADEIADMLRLVEFDYDGCDLVESSASNIYFKNNTLGAVE